MAYLRNDDLVIPQGTTWAVRWPIQSDDPSIDFTGWVVRSHVRRNHNSDNILYEWSTSIGNASIEDNFIEFRVTPEESSSWDWIRVPAVFDVELASPKGDVYRVTQGTIEVSPEVTR